MARMKLRDMRALAGNIVTDAIGDLVRHAAKRANMRRPTAAEQLHANSAETSIDVEMSADDIRALRNARRRGRGLV